MQNGGNLGASLTSFARHLMQQVAVLYSLLSSSFHLCTCARARPAFFINSRGNSNYWSRKLQHFELGSGSSRLKVHDYVFGLFLSLSKKLPKVSFLSLPCELLAVNLHFWRFKINSKYFTLQVSLKRFTWAVLSQFFNRPFIQNAGSRERKEKGSKKKLQVKVSN